MTRPPFRLAITASVVTLLGALGGGAGTAVAERPHYCPRGVPGFDANRLEGRREARAKSIAERHDCTVRVVKRDGVEYVVTDDFVDNRINVVIRAERVTRVRGVY